MNCHEFETWLDQGSPEDAAARQHERTCADCAERARAADGLEGALSQRFATAPDGFTERVMALLPARTGDEELTIPEDRESPWPWWVQILFEPSAALGLGLGILYAVASPTLLGTGQEVLPTLVTRVQSAVAALPQIGWLDGTSGAIALAGILVVTSLGLFRGSTLLFDRLARPRAR